MVIFYLQYVRMKVNQTFPHLSDFYLKTGILCLLTWNLNSYVMQFHFFLGMRVVGVMLIPEKLIEQGSIVRNVTILRASQCEDMCFNVLKRRSSAHEVVAKRGEVTTVARYKSSAVFTLHTTIWNERSCFVLINNIRNIKISWSSELNTNWTWSCLVIKHQNATFLKHLCPCLTTTKHMYCI